MRTFLCCLVLACTLAACGGSNGPDNARPSASASADEPAAVGATPAPMATQAPTSIATQVPPTATPPPAPTATPRPSGPATVLSRGPADRRVVALTFDAGADRGSAATILDVLAREAVPASFGITGVWTERNADLVTRMAQEGHVIINHSYDHSSFTGRSTTGVPLAQAQRFAQLDRAEQLILGATGKSTRPFFRPPYGDYDASVNTDVGALGYAFNVMWTVDSQGWTGLPANEIVRRCVNLAAPGAIYVFHVGAASADGQALPSIISQLRALGYGFVTISDFAVAGQ